MNLTWEWYDDRGNVVNNPDLNIEAVNHIVTKLQYGFTRGDLHAIGCYDSDDEHEYTGEWRIDTGNKLGGCK